MKHTLNISVSKKPKRNCAVSYRNVNIREKLLTRLFGPLNKVMVILPGNSVEALTITETPEGGDADEAVRNQC